MPIDALNDDLITLSQARRLKPLIDPVTRRPRDISAIHRWVQQGSIGANGRRIQLEAIRTPDGYRTTSDAVDRFLAALTDTNAPEGVAIERSAARRNRDSEAAETFLQGVGW